MGTTHLGMLGGDAPWWVVLPQGPPHLRWFLAPVFFFYCIKILQKVLFHFENFYFCTKNSIKVVLLKTTSVRVSFIQIMQIRVQNKSKSVRKSRYDRDVSHPHMIVLLSF